MAWRQWTGGGRRCNQYHKKIAQIELCRTLDAAALEAWQRATATPTLHALCAHLRYCLLGEKLLDHSLQ